MMTNYLALTQIVQKIAPQNQHLRAWSLTGGISAGMTAVAYQTASGQTNKIVVRQLHNAAALKNEYKTLQALQATAVKTPAPILFDDSGQILESPYLVIDFLAGERLFSPTNITSHMQQLADQLAAIHQIDLTQVAVSHLPAKTGCCEEMDKPRPWLASSDETKIEAALTDHSLPTQANPSALLHGDFWPGNMLWQDEKLTAVIDWEDAEVGDPLRDLAKSRSEIVWIFGFDAMQTFTHHYQSLLPLNEDNLPYWDLCAALRILRFAEGDLQKLTNYAAEFGRDDITAQTIHKHYRAFIDQAFTKL